VAAAIIFGPAGCGTPNLVALAAEQLQEEDEDVEDVEEYARGDRD
jgi:hypothetical protein